jgi:hypothetical protein
MNDITQTPNTATAITPASVGKITWPESTQAVKARRVVELKTYIAAKEYDAVSSIVPKPLLDTISEHNRAELEKVTQTTAMLADEQLGIDVNEEMQQAGFFDANTVWDDVSGLYNECASMLSTTTLISDMLRSHELMQHVDDRKLLIRNIVALAKDLTALSVDLTKIRALHKDHTGAAKSNEDFFLSMQIYTDYVNFIDRYTATAQPTVTWVSEMLQTALDSLAKVNPALAAEIGQNVQHRIRSISGILANTTGQSMTQQEQEAVIVNGALEELSH